MGLSLLKSPINWRHKEWQVINHTVITVVVAAAAAVTTIITTTNSVSIINSFNKQ